MPILPFLIIGGVVAACFITIGLEELKHTLRTWARSRPPEAP